MSEAAGQPDGGARDRWLGIEVRHLQALAAIAHEGSFREAADALGYVQSAISQQIAHLERLVGVRLIERARGNTPVTLTPAGELLLEHVEQILARYERAHEHLASLSEGLTGRLRIGMLQSVATRMLPQVLPRFAERCPGIDVVPSERTADTRLIDALRSGGLDLAFCELPLDDDELDHEELLADPLLVVAPAGSPLASGSGPVDPAELDDVPLIAFSHWRGQQRALDWLATLGVAPRVVFSSDHNATVQALVAADMGAAIAPFLAVDLSDPGTVARPLAGAPARTLAIAWLRSEEPAPAAAELRAVAREVAAELAGEIEAFGAW